MSQREFTKELVKQIQDINGNPALTALEKSEAIKNLKGVSKQDAFDYLNKNFRTGPGLKLKGISEDRPKGGPKKKDDLAYNVGG